MRLFGPQRYSKVPWLVAADLEAMGEPESSVESGGGAEITHGLVIVRPFGPETDAMLSIHASRRTGDITLAITAMVEIDQVPWHQRRKYQPYFDAPQYGAPRNPRSQPDDNGANDPDES